MANDHLLALKRGDVVQARFDPVEGSEQGGIRAAVVLSPDRANLRSAVMILAPLTTKNLDRIFPHEAHIPAGDGAPRESKALLGQIRTLSKSRILSFYGHLSDEILLEVDAALQIAVGLEKI